MLNEGRDGRKNTILFRPQRCKMKNERVLSTKQKEVRLKSH